MDQPKGRRHSLVSPLRRMMIFGVGSLLLMQEKTHEFVEQALERGQKAYDEGKRLAQEVRTGDEALSESPLSDTLERLDVPTQEDVRALQRQISALSAQIDELQSES